MPKPYTISVVVDVAATTVTNLLGSLRGRILSAPSLVQVSLNREAVGVNVSVLVGGESIMNNGLVTVLATLGVMPSIRDDTIITTFGDGQDEIIIDADNTTAGALETRAIVRVTEIDDVALAQALGALDIRGAS